MAKFIFILMCIAGGFVALAVIWLFGVIAAALNLTPRQWRSMNDQSWAHRGHGGHRVGKPSLKKT